MVASGRRTTRDGDLLIVGTGALATLFAARLARSGVGVTMLGTWAEGLQALRRDGARLVDAEAREERYPVAVSAHASDLPPIRYALVLVKSWQTERAARELATCLAPDGLALTLQNGLGNREILATRLGPERVALGSTTTGATLLGPGMAKPGGEGKISVESHRRLQTLAGMLESAGFEIEVVKDASAVIWRKLVINAAINPLTALLRIPNGQLLERPSARSLMHSLAAETAAVATAEGARMARRSAVNAVENVALRTAANHSSMFQDVLRGAPTEIDAICGAVARAGRKHQLPTPLNQACLQLVRALAETPQAAKGV
jgi:2-dehydropantoate 2-reductase